MRLISTLRRLVTATSTLGIFATTAGALEVVDYHPRIFVSPAQVPELRARAGIPDGTNATDYPGSWEQYLDEYNSLMGDVNDYSVVLEVSDSGNWSISDARKYSRQLGNLAMAYLLNADRSEGESIKNTILGLWELIVDDSRSRNGGSIGMSMDNNDWGKNSNWKGFCMAYDYLYDVLSQENPSLRDDVARWLQAQLDDGYDYIGGNSSQPIDYYEHYYKWPWCADGVWGGLLTIYGDPGIDQAKAAAMLDWTHAFKREDMLARDMNFCGTYSGYRHERIEEDVCTAFAWKTATDENPFIDYAFHLSNLDDWVMHMTRPNFEESDETGDGHDLQPINDKFIHFAYPSAVHDQNPYTLWFLDRAQDHVGFSSKPWVDFLFNDKSLPRIQPTLQTYPLAKYFGDLTIEDGHNAQYTHFRSRWDYSQDNTDIVHGSYLCGALITGHDLLSQGHLAFFRGQDILTISSGVYDGTLFPHTRYYHAAPISENTILVSDPNNPSWASSDTLDAIYGREGMQGRTPGTTGGGDMSGAEDPFSRPFAQGFVERFTTLDNGDAYLYSDITHAYANTDKEDLWGFATVENVSRQVTFQNGKYFILCDRVTSVNPDAMKRVLMHIPNREGYTLLDGAWTGGVAPHSVTHGGTPGQSTEDGMRYTWSRGDSRAFATVLYPAPESRGGLGRKLVRVGGANSQGEWNQSDQSGDPSYEFWLREHERNYRWNDIYMSSNDQYNHLEKGWACFWRMEIEATGAPSHTFLHVYEVTSAGQSQPVAVSYLEEIDAEHVGCAIDDPASRRVNVYSRDEEQDTYTNYRTALEGPIHHLVADLMAGIYVVESHDTGESFTVAVEEHANVAAFETEQGGRFSLHRLGDVADLAR